MKNIKKLSIGILSACFLVSGININTFAQVKNNPKPVKAITKSTPVIEKKRPNFSQSMLVYKMKQIKTPEKSNKNSVMGNIDEFYSKIPKDDMEYLRENIRLYCDIDTIKIECNENEKIMTFGYTDEGRLNTLVLKYNKDNSKKTLIFSYRGGYCQNILCLYSDLMYDLFGDDAIVLNDKRKKEYNDLKFNLSKESDELCKNTLNQSNCKFSYKYKAVKNAYDQIELWTNITIELNVPKEEIKK